MITVNIALGSNVGKPIENLEQAISEISALGIIKARSKFYLTPPWGITEQAEFVNAAIQIETDLSAQDLLKELKEIERRMGRGQTIRWGPRLIDLDILTYGDFSIDEPGLTVPHPHMLERAFVLVPLAEIDSRFIPARDALPESSLAEVRRL